MPAVAEIPDLWGDEIDVNVVEPVIILKTQAELLSKRTHGLIQATVRSSFVSDQTWIHTLVLEANSIARYEDVLHLKYDNTNPYPCELAIPSSEIMVEFRNCNDQEQLVKELSSAFRSSKVRTTLTNLLAKVNSRMGR